MQNLQYITKKCNTLLVPQRSCNLVAPQNEVLALVPFGPYVTLPQFFSDTDKKQNIIFLILFGCMCAGLVVRNAIVKKI